MSIQTPTSSDRLRTVWTTAMDRYFIELMLQQIDKGSRIDGHLFSKRAWRSMTLSFNTQFRLQYNREHLKNRHKTLRRVYRAVKNLLDQTGFNWDETQQMVTADDRTWSNYIKAHPEARSYRTKSIPYYLDLCKIYRDPASPLNSDQNASITNEVQEKKIPGVSSGLQSSPISGTREDAVDGEKGLAPNSGNGDIPDHILTDEGMVDTIHEIATPVTGSANGKEENNSVSTENVIDAMQTIPDTFDSTTSSRSRTYWQPPMDSYFIDLMLDQVHQGNQFDGTFRKHSWISMTELFNAKFGCKYDPIVLKNRYKTLKRQYNSIRVLLDQKGFFWDDVRKMVTADDHVWHEYIKAHPDAKQYITRPVPYYSDLCVIFSEPNVDERYSNAVHGIDHQDEVLALENGNTPGARQPQVISVAYGDPADALHEESSYNTFDRKNKDHATMSSCQNSKKPRRRYDEDFEDAFRETTVVESQHLGCEMEMNKHRAVTPVTSQRLNDDGMANAIREMAAVVSSLSEKMSEQENSKAAENVIHALQAVPDIDDDLLLDACDLLEDEKKATTFLSLDVRLRKKWLMRKLHPEQPQPQPQPQPQI